MGGATEFRFALLTLRHQLGTQEDAEQTVWGSVGRSGGDSEPLSHRWKLSHFPRFPCWLTQLSLSTAPDPGRDLVMGCWPDRCCQQV